MSNTFTSFTSFANIEAAVTQHLERPLRERQKVQPSAEFWVPAYEGVIEQDFWCESGHYACTSSKIEPGRKVRYVPMGRRGHSRVVSEYLHVKMWLTRVTLQDDVWVAGDAPMSFHVSRKIWVPREGAGAERIAQFEAEEAMTRRATSAHRRVVEACFTVGAGSEPDAEGVVPYFGQLLALGRPFDQPFDLRPTTEAEPWSEEEEQIRAAEDWFSKTGSRITHERCSRCGENYTVIEGVASMQSCPACK